MSAPFRITPRAMQDLQAIARYTLETWGRKQQSFYLRALDQRLSFLADNPRLGRPRPEVGQGYYSYPQGSHVIFYLMRERGIDIIGIPHQRMDIINYFSES